MEQRKRSFLWWWHVLVALSVLVWGWPAVNGWWMAIQGSHKDVRVEEPSEPSYRPPIARWKDEADSGQPAASVWLSRGNGHRVIVFRSSLGGLTPQQRAEAAVDRLRRGMRVWRVPPMVDVRQTPDGLRAVFVDDVRIATADLETARYNNTTCEGLARSWAENLRTAFAGHVDTDQP